tara:strand:+ start:249 stop:458 length:210 start_codon:yes stop_codon:yes gene_type:complete
MNLFTKLYRLLWLILILLLIFLDRQNPYWVIATLLLLIILSAIAVLRFLESRNEWREYIDEESLDEDII